MANSKKFPLPFPLSFPKLQVHPFPVFVWASKAFLGNFTYKHLDFGSLH